MVNVSQTWLGMEYGSDNEQDTRPRGKPRLILGVCAVVKSRAGSVRFLPLPH